MWDADVGFFAKDSSVRELKVGPFEMGKISHRKGDGPQACPLDEIIFTSSLRRRLWLRPFRPHCRSSSRLSWCPWPYLWLPCRSSFLCLSRRLWSCQLSCRQPSWWRRRSCQQLSWWHRRSCRRPSWSRDQPSSCLSLHLCLHPWRPCQRLCQDPSRQSAASCATAIPSPKTHATRIANSRFIVSPLNCLYRR